MRLADGKPQHQPIACCHQVLDLIMQVRQPRKERSVMLLDLLETGVPARPE